MPDLKENREKAKQYLKQIEGCDGCIIIIKSELREQQKAENECVKIIKGHKPEPPRPAVLRMLREQEEKRSAIIQQIRSLDNPLQVDVLLRFYVKREKLYKIAAALSYSEDRIAHVHLEALDAFYTKHLAGCSKK